MQLIDKHFGRLRDVHGLRHVRDRVHCLDEGWGRDLRAHVRVSDRSSAVNKSAERLVE